MSERHSFVELWRPPFISALVDEDRCHLNGLAMEEGRPRYVSAVSRSDTVDGWRDRRADRHLWLWAAASGVCQSSGWLHVAV